MFDNTRRLHRRGPASRGLAIDVDGAIVGPECVLIRRMEHGYRCIAREEAAALQDFLVGNGWAADWLFEQCRRIATALDKGELAFAQILGLYIPIDDLDGERLDRLALAASFLKANFNPDEPRIPAGQSGGGEWTTEGGENSGHDEQGGSLIDIAYQGTYHDQVVSELAAHWRAQGNTVLTSVDLIGRNGVGARADIIAVLAPGEPPVVVEVKTGSNPQYTPGQRVIYPMAQIGDHVYSPNTKIRELGFSPGQWLPPMTFVAIYKQDEQSPYRWMVHPNPLLP